MKHFLTLFATVLILSSCSKSKSDDPAPASTVDPSTFILGHWRVQGNSYTDSFYFSRDSVIDYLNFGTHTTSPYHMLFNGTDTSIVWINNVTYPVQVTSDTSAIIARYKCYRR